MRYFLLALVTSFSVSAVADDFGHARRLSRSCYLIGGAFHQSDQAGMSCTCGEKKLFQVRENEDGMEAEVNGPLHAVSSQLASFDLECRSSYGTLTLAQDRTQSATRYMGECALKDGEVWFVDLGLEDGSGTIKTKIGRTMPWTPFWDQEWGK